MLPLAIAFEHHRWRAHTPLEWFSIVHTMARAIAVCHVVWSKLARNLPQAASGLSVMMIPVLGGFSTMAVHGERPYRQDDAARVLILGALATMVLGPRPARLNASAAIPDRPGPGEELQRPGRPRPPR